MSEPRVHWEQVEPRRRYRARLDGRDRDLVYQGRGAVGPSLDVGWYLEGGTTGTKAHEFMARRLRDAAERATKLLRGQDEQGE